MNRTDLRNLVQEVPGDWPPPSSEEIAMLGAEYTAITGKRVTAKMHGLLAKGLRVHGPRARVLLEDLYKERGTVTNLLADLVAAPRATPVAAGTDVVPVRRAKRNDVVTTSITKDSASERVDHVPIDETGRYVGLTYGPHNRPLFDPTSSQRYDRRSAEVTALASRRRPS